MRAIRAADDVEKLAKETTETRVEASGKTLTATLLALRERAPQLRTLHIAHRASGRIETASIEALAGFAQLEVLSLVGDATLLDAEFAALGKLSTLESLGLGLP